MGRLEIAIRPFLIILSILAMGNATHAQGLLVPNGYVMSEDIPLRMRAGPGLNYPVLALLADGSPLQINARNRDSTWLEVITSDQAQPGWVFRAYVNTALDLSTLPVHANILNFSSLISGISDEARRIYARGQLMGNQANIFAKVGDSITVSNSAFQPIGEGRYTLGSYSYLQPVINYFASSAFLRQSMAAGVGWSAAAVLLPEYADSSRCQPGEMPLRCEYRVTHPAFALIMFGTNDVGYVPLATFRHNMERIISISSDMGVVPVLSTIPPRRGFDDQVAAYNQLIRDLSQSYQLPLWDYGLAMSAYLPESLGFDGVHPSLPPRGREDAANFQAENLPYGYVLRNLSALHLLDALWHQIVLYQGKRTRSESGTR